MHIFYLTMISFFGIWDCKLTTVGIKMARCKLRIPRNKVRIARCRVSSEFREKYQNCKINKILEFCFKKS